MQNASVLRNVCMLIQMQMTETGTGSWVLIIKPHVEFVANNSQAHFDRIRGSIESLNHLVLLKFIGSARKAAFEAASRLQALA